MIPFCCPVCGILDGNGIDGHMENRCKGAIEPATPEPAVRAEDSTRDEPSEAPAAAVKILRLGSRKRKKYNAYMRDYMRKRRAGNV